MGLLRILLRIFAAPRRSQRPTLVVVPRTLDDGNRHSPWDRSAPAPVPRDGTVSVAIRIQTMTCVTGRCYVVDGDTIVIDNTMIRLAGIDAPELDQPYGKNAKWALIRLCQGQVVTASFEGADHYDRTVATCRLPDGRDLSAEMVSAGLALDWPKFSGGRYRALEVPGIRKKLWRVDARQKGRFPPMPRA